MVLAMPIRRSAVSGDMRMVPPKTPKWGDGSDLSIAVICCQAML
jgi:hypothetical protein